MLSVQKLLTSAHIEIEEFESRGLILRKIEDTLDYEKTWNVMIKIQGESYRNRQKFINNCIQKLAIVQQTFPLVIELRNNLTIIYNILSNTISLLPNHWSVYDNDIPESIEQFVSLSEESNVQEVWNSMKNGELTLNMTFFAKELENKKTYKDQWNRYVDDEIILEQAVDILVRGTLTNMGDDQILQQIAATSEAIDKYLTVHMKTLEYLISQRPVSLDAHIIPTDLLDDLLMRNTKNHTSARDTRPRNMRNIDRLRPYSAMKCSISNNQVVIEASIPYLQFQPRNTYSAIAAPNTHHKATFFIVPRTNYFSVNKEETDIKYYDKNHLEQCWAMPIGVIYVPNQLEYFILKM